MKKKKEKNFLAPVLAPALAAAVLLAFLAGVSNVTEDSGARGREQLETALRRSAVACYAAEGIYPADLNYLREHYGVQIDEERYTVIYDAFASNLMPDITVLEN